MEETAKINVLDHTEQILYTWYQSAGYAMARTPRSLNLRYKPIYFYVFVRTLNWVVIHPFSLFTA